MDSQFLVRKYCRWNGKSVAILYESIIWAFDVHFNLNHWMMFFFLFLQSVYLFWCACACSSKLSDSNAIRYTYKSHFGNITPTPQIGFVAMHASKVSSSFGVSKTRSSFYFEWCEISVRCNVIQWSYYSNFKFKCKSLMDETFSNNHHPILFPSFKTRESSVRRKKNKTPDRN